MARSGWAPAAEQMIREFVSRPPGDHQDACTGANNSIGTHTFLEFGPLQYVVARSGEKIPRGILTLWVRAYEWRMIAGAKTLLTSETVSPDELFRVFEAHLQGRPFPELAISECGSLRIMFGEGIEILVEPHAEGPDDWYFEEEVQISTWRNQYLNLSLAGKSCSISFE